MILCKYKKKGDGRFKCARCGHTRTSHFRADQLHRQCGTQIQSSSIDINPSYDCLHRGDELRREECKTCSGKVQVKVFTCELFGECTVGKPLDSVPNVCASCPNRSTIARIPRSGKQRIVIHAHVNEFTGYGRIIKHVGRELELLGQEVRYIPIRIDRRFTGISDFMRGRIVYDVGPDDWVLYSHPPDVQEPLPGSVVLTMWESTRLPAGAAERLNKQPAVIVPCRWVKESFQASGAAVPIHVVPMGIDHSIYQPSDHFPEVFTVGAAGRVSHGGMRKGLDDMIHIFKVAFPHENVRLILKAWPDCDLMQVDDSRITIDRRALTEPELAEWYRGLSVFASASCAEGFGFQPLEAMACGRPVIATNYSGHESYVGQQQGWVVEWDEMPVAHAIYQSRGMWGLPRMSSMLACLRCAYAADREKLQEKGWQAVRMAERFKWSDTAKGVLSVLKSVHEKIPAMT